MTFRITKSAVKLNDLGNLELDDIGILTPKSNEILSEKVDVICACLPGPMEAKEVVFGENGIINSIKPGTIFIDHTTNSIEVIKDIPIGVYAKNSYPKKTDKSVGKGETGLTLEFQNFIVQKDSWAYVDTNGIIFSEKELEF